MSQALLVESEAKAGRGAGLGGGTGGPPGRGAKGGRGRRRPDRVKVTITLSEEVLDAVQELARDRDTTMTEIFRQAITTEKYLHDAQKEGGKILIENGRKTREVVFR